jgi:hypothetical protein
LREDGPDERFATHEAVIVPADRHYLPGTWPVQQMNLGVLATDVT